jgi:hypothetical protein
MKMTETFQGAMPIVARRLLSGWFHLRGVGPCNWAQINSWDAWQVEGDGAFCEASDDFRRAARRYIETHQPPAPKPRAVEILPSSESQK